MANQIVFLGTAGDSMVAARQDRASGGIIMQIGGNQFQIDPGPGAVVRAAEAEINLRANTAIFVSNANILNCNDVNAVIDAMSYGGLDKGGVLVTNQTLVNGAEGIRPYLTETHERFLERIIVMKPGQKLGIENIEIHAMAAETKDPNALGFKFFTDDFVLGYVGDTGYSKELIKNYKGVDILIINVVLPAGQKSDFALDSENTAKLIKGVNPKLAIITHFGTDMLKADPLNEGRRIQKETGVQVLVAKDGMSFSPSSYSARSDQKRLGGFKNQETGEVQPEEKKIHIVEQESEESPEEQEPAAEEHEDHQESLEF